MLRYRARTQMGPRGPASKTELAERFAREAAPLIDRLSGVAMRLTGNKQDAEDLVQETLLRAYAGFESFREGTNLNAWMYRIMHNTWITLHRRKQRRPAEVLVGDFGEEKVAAHARHSLRSAEVTALETFPEEAIKCALLTLREECRTAVYYADVEGLSYKEIADLTDSSLSAVMSRLHRGRRRLRTALAAVACERGLTPPPTELAKEPA
ncbi:sigma-70 family RNA polymerase sigma factor [Mycobacterium sp. 21AC1]|uniref:sigma-70 family RNA polymerase sigma factor n=1 Tax=[Mycobacterium] appelbergii TaxID=2939269 RepID=UPI002938FE1F|nr:sigma-70 family RNA polymerase sigma factor [Mycobacterium sp. 21AC1]MDV3123619.1 sigma-70 family RNA polymerase sigma factor [Mycobacterium sp. 21AC1]